MEHDESLEHIVEALEASQRVIVEASIEADIIDLLTRALDELYTVTSSATMNNTAKVIDALRLAAMNVVGKGDIESFRSKLSNMFKAVGGGERAVKQFSTALTNVFTAIDDMNTLIRTLPKAVSIAVGGSVKNMPSDAKVADIINATSGTSEVKSSSLKQAAARLVGGRGGGGDVLTAMKNVIRQLVTSTLTKVTGLSADAIVEAVTSDILDMTYNEVVKLTRTKVRDFDGEAAKKRVTDIAKKTATTGGVQGVVPRGEAKQLMRIINALEKVGAIEVKDKKRLSELL